MVKNITFNYNDEDIKYRLYAVFNDGKVIPQHVGYKVDLTWYQVYGRIERIKQMKAGWIAKREFPVKKMKIVEISTKWKRIVEEETTKSTTDEEIV